MPSAFSHAVASVALGKASFIKRTGAKFWLLTIFCATIPDADTIGFNMGVPYDSMWGHRGITHSFFFAALLSFVVTYFFYRKEKIFSRQWAIYFIFFFVVTASHPILDAMTNGGRGVAFFAPFDNTRYFFPFRPIRVSPLSITRFFTYRGLEVLKSEFVWVWVPSFIVIGIAEVIKRIRSKHNNSI